MKTLTVILEYCGGSRTDYLFDRLKTWNPGREIDVLDNASETNRCKCITQQNKTNTFVGGGIIDCFRLAEARNYDNLFFIVNDIEPVTPILIDQFEAALAENPRLIQVAASVTDRSRPHAIKFPWMVVQPSKKTRRVPHSDLLCCILRISFVRSFGGFPLSRGGWGYDLELAHQALVQGFHIAIADWSVVQHEASLTIASRRARYLEMLDAYKNRYPNDDFIINRTIAEYWKLGIIQLI